MNIIITTIICLCLPFIANALGASLVFFFKRNFSNRTSDIILGLASGIMIAAAIFGLLIPSIEQGEKIYQDLSFLPIAGGFILGGIILSLIDHVVPHVHLRNNEAEGPKVDISEEIKFFLAVTIHNIPEGLAVGFACGMALNTNDPIYISSALSLAIGIAIQNFPEGAAVSIPMLESGISKVKSFIFGSLSSIVEPLFAGIGILIATQLTLILPWLLSFGAGAMFYVTVEELIPSSQKSNNGHFGLWAFMIGFVLMLLLEILL